MMHWLVGEGLHRSVLSAVSANCLPSNLVSASRPHQEEASEHIVPVVIRSNSNDGQLSSCVVHSVCARARSPKKETTWVNAEQLVVMEAINEKDIKLEPMSCPIGRSLLL